MTRERITKEKKGQANRSLPLGVDGLEADDDAAFTAEVSPLVLRNALEQRIVNRAGRAPGRGVGAGAIERLFIRERDPPVEFVIEGPDGHVAA